MRAPPTQPILAGVCGVGACDRVSAVTQPILAAVLGRVRLCARSACTPPLPAGVCGVGVCASVRVSAAARHSCLGCWVGCAFFLARPVARQSLLWCWSVGVSVRALAASRQSWLGCAVWVCLLGFGLWLRPAIPGLGVRGCAFVLAPHVPRQSWLGCGCMCVCVRSACTPPVLTGLCDVGVRVSAAPRHSWLGCFGMCVCVRARPLLANPGSRLLSPYVRLGFGVRPANPGLGVGACVFVCALRMYPASSGSGVRCGCVCLPVPAIPGLGVGVHVLVCANRMLTAITGSGSWCVGCGLPDTFSRAVVRCVLCAFPWFVAPGGRCC